MQIKRSLIVGLMLGLLATGVVRGEDAEARYEAQWGLRERTARTDAERNALAEELLLAVDTAADKPMKVLLAKKAFEAGSRDLGGYASAARALDQLQRIAPEERIWALEKLKFLYESAYRIAPTNAGLAHGLIGTLEELAAQRIEDARAAFDTGQADATTTARTFQAALRDVRVAESTLQRLVRRIEGDIRRLATSAPDRALEYRKFIDSLEPDARRLARQASNIQADVRFWMQLLIAERRFEARPDPDAAKAVAQVYLAELNQPEMIDAKFVEMLPEEYKQAVVRSCVPVGQLSGKAAATLGDFYQEMAAGASDTAAKQKMFVRARLYHQRAGNQGVDASKAAISNIDMMLNGFGLTSSGITEQTHALNNRLTYQFKGAADTEPTVTNTSPPAGTTVAQSTTPESAVTTRNNTTTTTRPATNTTSTASSTTPIHVPTAASRTVRPMVSCITCGRRFFPGWGADLKANHQCDGCTNGRGSIFDMGK